MRDIYPQSRKVLVWLGEADDSTMTAFETLEKLADVYKRLVTNIQRRDALKSLIVTENGFLSALEAVTRLTFRPWFDRCWTFQEIILSHNAGIACGNYTMSWKSFYKGSSVYNNSRTLFATHVYPNENAYQMGREWRLKSKSNHQTFLSRLLYRTDKLGATDPRDKIFALLGLADFNNPSLFQPRYDVSVRDTYIHFTRAMIKEEQSLCALVQCGRGGDRGDLPSWVPDWSGKRQNSGIGFESQSYAASDNYVHELTYDVNGSFLQDLSSIIVDTSPILFLRGALIDHVVDVYNLKALRRNLEGLGSGGGNWKFTPLLSAFAKEIGLKSKHSCGASSPEEILLRTLSAGHWYFTTRRDVRNQSWQSHAALRRAWGMGDQKERRISKDEMQRLPLDVAQQIYGAAIPSRFLEAMEGDTPDSATNWQRPSGMGEKDLETFMKEASGEAMQWVGRFSWNRVLFFVSRSYIGIAPHKTKPGDKVCTLFGADVPFILHQRESNPEHFEMIGSCYVDGIMDGELFNVSPDKSTIEPVDPSVEIRDFTLV
jgi:hypothetical protein